jgi:Holliday junction resolvase RusA-like endonuclease
VILLVVHGAPAPQGSKKPFIVKTKDGKIRAAQKEASDKVEPWREAVKAVALQHLPDAPLDGPLELRSVFLFRRPASHYGAGRNADRLKERAPIFRLGTPDQSKLIRSTEDALTDAGVWTDDARVVSHRAVKAYSNDGFAGAVLLILEADATAQLMADWARAVASERRQQGWPRALGSA